MVDYPIASAIGVGDQLFLRNGMGTAETTRDGRKNSDHTNSILKNSVVQD